MHLLKLPNGGAIETYGIPPRGFDLGAASEGELERFGLKGLTQDPVLRARLVSQLRELKFIAPTFSPRETTPRVQESGSAAGCGRGFRCARGEVPEAPRQRGNSKS